MRLSKSIDDNRDVHATLIATDVGSSDRKRAEEALSMVIA
jgi:hypothetical protein